MLSGRRGICNVFFKGCNLKCVYCQNYQISRAAEARADSGTPIPDIVDEIERLLKQGCHGVGFVSASHFVPQTVAIIRELKSRGCAGPFVYNSNGYDKVDILRALEDHVSVYLPDLKYMDNDLARALSGASDYVDHATAAIHEMYRQKGPRLLLNDDGIAEFGLIIRHLILPGFVENSLDALRWIAEELSTEVHISLMSQYHPTPTVKDHPTLSRTLYPEEYHEVVAEFDRLGFYRGWVQELESPAVYRPDFDKQHPFED